MMSPAPYRGPRRSFFRSRAFLLTVAAVVALVAAWIASELLIPPIAARYVRNEIRERYPDATGVAVTVKAFPAIRLAFRDYDRVSVAAGSISLQGVRFDHISARSTKWPFATYRAVLGQDEMARFFSLRHSYVLDPVMRIAPAGVSVSGKVDIGVAVVDIEALGTLECSDGKRVFFKPADVQVSGTSIAGQGVAAVRQVMRDNPVFAVRDDLPYTISTVTAGEGRIVLTGLVDLERALNMRL